MEPILVALVGFSLVISAISWLLVAGLRRRLNQVLGGGESLEQSLLLQAKRLVAYGEQAEKMGQRLDLLRDELSLASQKISLVRFNPFGDTGGNHSFALAVLDAHNSGYIMTSIHGREGTRMYIKPIDYGKSKYNLSGEEQQALEQASKRVIMSDRE